MLVRPSTNSGRRRRARKPFDFRSKSGDMRGDFRAFPLGKASLHERTAGRTTCRSTSECVQNLDKVPIALCRYADEHPVNTPDARLFLCLHLRSRGAGLPVRSAAAGHCLRRFPPLPVPLGRTARPPEKGFAAAKIAPEYPGRWETGVMRCGGESSAHRRRRSAPAPPTGQAGQNRRFQESRY